MTGHEIGLQEALHSLVRRSTRSRGAIKDYSPGDRMIGVGRTDGGQGGEYAAILYRDSRLSVRRGSTFWLSDTPEVVKSNTWAAALERICTWALFDDKLGTPFYLYNLHLDHASSRLARKASLCCSLESASARLCCRWCVTVPAFSSTVYRPKYES